MAFVWLAATKNPPNGRVGVISGDSLDELDDQEE